MASNLLSLAGQALNTAEEVLAVAANNTANSDNAHYVAETANVTDGPLEEPVIGALSGSAGGGVAVAGITNASDPVLDRLIQSQTSRTGYWTQMATQMAAIQPLFNEPQTGGLQEMLTQFGSAWTALQDNPGSTAEAASVLSSGQALATTIQTVQNQLAQQATTLIGQLGTQMQTLAAASRTLAHTNGTLAGLEPESAAAAQADDTIQGAIATLASTASIDTTPAAGGGVDVTSGGVTLVHGTTTPSAQDYAVQTSGTGPWYRQTVSLTIGGAAYQPTRGAIAGTVAALAAIQQTGQQLATLSQALATHVPTGGTSPAAVFTATANGALAVHASVTASTIQSGAASTALTAINAAISQWTTIVGAVGHQGSEATTEQAHQQADLSALQTQQQSVQGVNLNQTAAQTVQAQESYQAAAQLVQVQQSLIHSLLAAVA